MWGQLKKNKNKAEAELETDPIYISMSANQGLREKKLSYRPSQSPDFFLFSSNIPREREQLL